MKAWLSTFVWTLFHEVLGVVLSILLGLGFSVVFSSFVARLPWLALGLGLMAVAIALSVWWKHASHFVMEPDPILAEITGDTYPLSARIAADLSTAAVGLTIISICVQQIMKSEELTARWALLATILGGPFFALGMGAVWERVDRRIFR